MAEWKTVRLGEIVKTNQSTYSPKENWQFVNYLDTGNITMNKIDEIQNINTAKDKLPSRARRKVKTNSIIYSTVRPNQLHYGIIKKQPDNFLVSTGFTVIDVNYDKAVPDFIYYALTKQEVTEKLQAIAEQSVSAYPSLKPSDIENLELMLPDKKTQERIVAILRSIDKKIKVNNAINNNLEQQAQAIFKSWFVDFEPFGGVIPSDWRQGKLGDSCNCILGGTPSRNKSEYWNGSIPWINSGEVNKFRIIKPSETITNLGLEKSATKLLPAKTTVLAITGATLGQVSLLEIDACANQSVVGIIPNDNLPYEYVYPLIKQNIAELISHQTGGAQQHINKQNVENLDIVIPAYTHLMKYQNTVCGIYEMIANNCFENDRLSSVRDIILPKLMSGKLDVSKIKI